MFTRSKEFIKSSNSSPEVFIDDSSPFNSELLRKLDQCSDRYRYTITKFENRIDLISEDIYGTDDYSWILLYINRVSIKDLVRGLKITYIDKNKLMEIIDSI